MTSSVADIDERKTKETVATGLYVSHMSSCRSLGQTPSKWFLFRACSSSSPSKGGDDWIVSTARNHCWGRASYGEYKLE